MSLVSYLSHISDQDRRSDWTPVTSCQPIHSSRKRVNEQHSYLQSSQSNLSSYNSSQIRSRFYLYLTNKQVKQDTHLPVYLVCPHIMYWASPHIVEGTNSTLRSRLTTLMSSNNREPGNDVVKSIIIAAARFQLPAVYRVPAPVPT